MMVISYLRLYGLAALAIYYYHYPHLLIALNGWDLIYGFLSMVVLQILLGTSFDLFIWTGTELPPTSETRKDVEILFEKYFSISVILQVPGEDAMTIISLKVLGAIFFGWARCPRHPVRDALS